MKRHIIVYFALIANLSICLGQKKDDNNSFDKELKRLNTHTAQVFGRDIVQMPNWSANSDVLYCKKESGETYSINLSTAKLTVGVWHKDTIGVISTNLIHLLTPKEIEDYNLKYKKNNSRETASSIKTKSQTIVKFVQSGLTTTLITKEKNKPEKIEWISGSVCGGIILSPNEKYIAFYCETIGVFIMKLN